MAAQQLTARSVAALQYSRRDGHLEFTWDAKIVGLAVRQTAHGFKSYVLRYRVLSRQRIATLGDVRVHSLDAARKWARDGLSKADHGIDFQDEGARARVLGTVSDCWTRYMNEQIRAHGSPRTVTALQSLWRQHLQKPFGTRRPTEITTPEIRAWHRKLSVSREIEGSTITGKNIKRMIGGPYTANRAVQALRAAINFAINRGDGSLPPDFRNPCAGVSLNSERAREVILRPSELPRLASAIADHPDPYARAFVWLSLYTGARRGELLGLTWADVDLKTKYARFGRTKNGRPHEVPLAAEAVRLLKALPRRANNGHVFPARHGLGHRSNIKDAWSDIRGKAGLPHLHVHDLRRTVGSWLGASGNTANMVGELLNHKSEITSRVYVQLGQMDVKRQLTNENARLLAKALRGKERKVVPSSKVPPHPK